MTVTWGSGAPVAKIVMISDGDLDNLWAELVLVESLIGSCGIKSFPAGMHICMPLSELNLFE